MSCHRTSHGSQPRRGDETRRHLIAPAGPALGRGVHSAEAGGGRTKRQCPMNASAVGASASVNAIRLPKRRIWRCARACAGDRAVRGSAPP